MADTAEKQRNLAILWTNEVRALVLALYELYAIDQRFQASGIAWSDEVVGVTSSPVKYTTAAQLTASQTLVRQLLQEMTAARRATLEAVVGS